MIALKNCWLRCAVVAVLMSLCAAKVPVVFAQESKDLEHKAEAAAEAAMEVEAEWKALERAGGCRSSRP